jgi:hypothetical protein
VVSSTAPALVVGVAVVVLVAADVLDAVEADADELDFEELLPQAPASNAVAAMSTGSDLRIEVRSIEVRSYPAACEGWLRASCLLVCAPGGLYPGTASDVAARRSSMRAIERL